MEKVLTRRKVVERVWFSKDVKENILRKSDGVCAHCGCRIAVGDNFTVEHVVPISKGGTNELVNIVALCHACNVTKGDGVWHPYEYLEYLHTEDKDEISDYIDKYFHDRKWFTRNNFCQVDFKKIEVSIPITGRQKTISKNNQTILARACKLVYYKLQKALYCDLQEIYDMQIAYLKRNKLAVDKVVIKETISDAYTNGAIYYVARGDGSKVGFFAVQMEERSIDICNRSCPTPMLVFSNIITTSSLRYVCEAVRDAIDFVLQQFAIVIDIDGIGLCAVEMYSNSAFSKVAFETCACFGTNVSSNVTTTFWLHKFCDPVNVKHCIVNPSQLLNIVTRMRVIGDEMSA